MNRYSRLYYYTLLGAMGGLIAWQISNMLGLSFLGTLYLSEIVIGGLIGLSIGLLIGLSEGISMRSPGFALRAGLIGGGLGLLAGAIALPIAEAVFQFLGGAVWARAAGWALFGTLLGFGIGAKTGSNIWKPALGGFLGGALGGLLLDAVRLRFNDPLLGKAVGLSFLGASVGIFIALVVLILSKAWLEVVSGKMKGTEFILDKFIHAGGPSAYVGSNALKADIVLPDPDVESQHAMITGADTRVMLKDMSLAGTFVNRKRIQQVNLEDHQTIQMGNTQMVYHEKR